MGRSKGGSIKTKIVEHIAGNAWTKFALHRAKR
jgi:hypothetical protein